MDSRLRLIERGVAKMGSPYEETRLILERLRAEEVSEQQVLLGAAAGMEPARMALGISAEKATCQCAAFLPVPTSNLFEPIVEQVKVVWGLNQSFGWGFTVNDFLSLPLPTAWPTGRLPTWTLVPSLPTVQATFDGQFRAIQARHSNVWRWDELKSDPKNLKLLDGIIHPGKCLRWEAIDLGANWDQEEGIAPRDVRNAQSPHAGILASAAIHTKWVEAMDGTNVPYAWAPGYQCFYSGRWSAVPWLGFHQSVRRVQLIHRNDGSHDQGSAVPAPAGVPVGA